MSTTTYTVPKLDDYSAGALDKAAAELLAALDAEVSGLHSESEWKDFRDRWMARKNGILTQVNDFWLKAAPGPAKRDVGPRVNQLKQKVEGEVEAALAKAQGGGTSKLAAEKVDITLPGIRRPLGVEHPIIRTMNEIVKVFR